MKRDTFIETLARELPARGVRSVSATRFFVGWVAVLLPVSLGIVAYTGLRNNLSQVIGAAYFIRESLLWIALMLAAGWLVYVSGVPGRSRTAGVFGIAATTVALGALLLARANHAVGLGEALRSELHLYRSPCAILIFVSAALVALYGIGWSRRAAPSRPGVSGAAIAIASGACGTVLMQIVCRHDSTAHLMLWHVTPILILATIGARVGPRLLAHWPRAIVPRKSMLS